MYDCLLEVKCGILVETVVISDLFWVLLFVFVVVFDGIVMEKHR